MLRALGRTRHDLVTGNAIKVIVIAAVTALSLPVFIFQAQVARGPALLLAAGFGVGGQLGARLAVRGGKRLIRPILAIAVIALAFRLLDWLSRAAAGQPGRSPAPAHTHEPPTGPSRPRPPHRARSTTAERPGR